VSGAGEPRLDAQRQRRGPGPGAGTGEEWIVDTGPVIVLAKIGRLDLLTRLGRAVLLPSPGVQDIRRGPAVGPARPAVEAGGGAGAPVR